MQGTLQWFCCIVKKKAQSIARKMETEMLEEVPSFALLGQGKRQEIHFLGLAVRSTEKHFWKIAFPPCVLCYQNNFARGRRKSGKDQKFGEGCPIELPRRKNACEKMALGGKIKVAQ